MLDRAVPSGAAGGSEYFADRAQRLGAERAALNAGRLHRRMVSVPEVADAIAYLASRAAGPTRSSG